MSPVIPAPGNAKPDWQIIGEIAVRFDQYLGKEPRVGQWIYSSAKNIMEEIRIVTPIYGGVTYERLIPDGLQWPCPDDTHPGTRILHEKGFSRGLGRFHPIKAQDPAEETDEEYPFILTTGRMLYHYHTGTMTRRSEPLAWREPGRYVEINIGDAQKLSIQDGDAIILRSRRGSVNVNARVGHKVPEGTLFLAFHWREAPANRLTQDFELDPVAKIPEYKISAVQIEKSN
jgi:formate dehydrogenase major subunit/formate dehydrogenase alpha subunit